MVSVSSTILCYESFNMALKFPSRDNQLFEPSEETFAVFSLKGRNMTVM